MKERTVTVKEIPVVFAANNDYTPYIGVAISSLISCASEKHVYFVYVLHRNITAANQERLEELSTKNVTVKCRDVSKEMKGIRIISSNHLTAESTFRILIPELFPQYDKMVYLDSDVVVLRDVAGLYDIDLDGHVLGVVRHTIDDKLLEYIDDRKIGTSFKDYFNAGVLLIDINRFIEQRIRDKCFNILDGETHYLFLDNDALNLTCQGDVKYLDERWNLIWYYWLYEPLPAYIEPFRASAADPWILHFASHMKPWEMPEVKQSRYFWNYARNTPFYEEIIYKNTKGDNIAKRYYLPYGHVPLGSTVAVYGAGAVGRAFYQQICLTGLYRMAVWVDSNYQKLQEKGQDVYAPKALQDEIFDYVLIAVEKRDVAEEILKTLVEMGIEQRKIVWNDPRVRIKL